MNAIIEINGKDRVNEIFLFCKPKVYAWMEFALFTLVNWINRIQEMVQGIEKSNSRFKRDNCNKISFI